MLASQVRLLYANGAVSFLVTILAATMLGLLQWPIVAHETVLGWCLYMVAVAAGRFVLALRFGHTSPALDKIRAWRTAFTFGVTLSGIGWGAAGILLYPEAHSWNQVFLVFVLGGMMLGGASLLAPRPEAFLLFLVPTGFGPVVRFLLHGDLTHYVMGLLAAVFTLATIMTTSRIYRTIDSSLRLQFDNRDLLDDLQVAKNQAEALNQVLELKVEERTAELLQSIALLENEIAQRKIIEAELSHAQQALLDSEKLAATARLAATMAHEINNPLAAITNLIYLLTRLQISPEARAYVSMLEQQVTGLSRIATQMLKFHRDSNQPTEFAMKDVLSEVLEFYRSQADRKQIQIDQRIETDGTMVGFRGEIVQVVTNLLLNAIEATPAGGHVTIHLCSAPRLASKANHYGGYRLTIADNGRGIDPIHRERIFQPFFTTKGDKGTGLGLWLCKGIVSRVGGSIRVRSTSRPGQSGTCFCVFLPTKVSATNNLVRRRYE